MRLTGTVHKVLDERTGRSNGRDWSIREVKVLDEEDLHTVSLGDDIPTPKTGDKVDFSVSFNGRQTPSGIVVQLRATSSHAPAGRGHLAAAASNS